MFCIGTKLHVKTAPWYSAVSAYIRQTVCGLEDCACLRVWPRYEAKIVSGSKEAGKFIISEAMFVGVRKFSCHSFHLNYPRER